MLKGARPGWKASANFQVNLAEFISMCNHLSDNENFLSTDSVISENFKTYTGMPANPYNISRAFGSGVLYSSQYLEEKLATKQIATKRRCKGIRNQLVDTFASSHPEWCT